MECEEETKKCKMTEFFMEELREYKHLHLNIDANKIKFVVLNTKELQFKAFK